MIHIQLLHLYTQVAQRISFCFWKNMSIKHTHCTIVFPLILFACILMLLVQGKVCSKKKRQPHIAIFPFLIMLIVVSDYLHKTFVWRPRSQSLMFHFGQDLYYRLMDIPVFLWKGACLITRVFLHLHYMMKIHLFSCLCITISCWSYFLGS